MTSSDSARRSDMSTFSRSNWFVDFLGTYPSGLMMCVLPDPVGAYENPECSVVWLFLDSDPSK